MSQTQDLEDLFDTIAAATAAGNANAGEHHGFGTVELFCESDDAKNVVSSVGHMARSLHDALRDLGLNKEVGKAASSIPDARDRLNYVANMTQQAADKVLTATEAAQPVVASMREETSLLVNEWSRLATMTPDELRSLVARNCAYLSGSVDQLGEVNNHLVDIMMAQDFQDLTGQVIKKIIVITTDMEEKLLSILLEHAPAEFKEEIGVLNGPVINSIGRADVVTSQDQVDDLLESMGF